MLHKHWPNKLTLLAPSLSFLCEKNNSCSLDVIFISDLFVIPVYNGPNHRQQDKWLKVCWKQQSSIVFELTRDNIWFILYRNAWRAQNQSGLSYAVTIQSSLQDDTAQLHVWSRSCVPCLRNTGWLPTLQATTTTCSTSNKVCTLSLSLSLCVCVCVCVCV